MTSCDLSIALPCTWRWSVVLGYGQSDVVVKGKPALATGLRTCHQVLWGHLYGVLLVGEPETVFAVGGSALIATGVLSLSLRPSPNKEAGGAAAGAPQLGVAAPARPPAPEASVAAAGAAAVADAEGAPVPVAPGPEWGQAEARPPSQRAWLRWARRLWGWAGRRADPQARHCEGEAEGLVSCSAHASAAVNGTERPYERGVLQGQWAGTAEDESPRHTVLLVPPDR